MIEQKKENEKQAQHIQKLEEQVKGLTEKK
jgi:hypothetical protein